MNGKKLNGKVYNKNGVFEYEIKDGKGKIIEYNEDGYLQFVGEFLNGKRNGKGKTYHCYSRLQYEGEFLNGKENGFGKNYNYDGKL